MITCSSVQCWHLFPFYISLFIPVLLLQTNIIYNVNINHANKQYLFRNLHAIINHNYRKIL